MRRIFTGVTAAMLSAGAMAAPAAGQQAGERMVGELVSAISPQRIEAHVRKLVSFQTRHTMSDTVSDTQGIGAARRWIKAELERCGAQAGGRLQVAFDSHVAPVSKRISRPTEIVNVVATLPGSQPQSAERIYVVSGHYDSRATDVMDARGDAPGANDDASGTAAVIEMACVMARYQFDATLVFMAVAAEEQGLLGSGHWAQQAKLKNLNIAGMLNNDIIGSSRADDGTVDGGQVRLFAEGIPAVKEMSDGVRALVATGGENDSISRQLARHVKQVGERHVPGFRVNVIQRADRYLRGGDHMPFLAQGYAALRFTEPHEDFAHQHQDVRVENGVQYGDLPQFVDYDYVAKVAKVNAAALASLALAPAAPSTVQVRTAQLENATTADQWQGAQDVGNVTQARVNLSKDNYFFGVQAIDKDGNVSVATYPMPLR